jgi:hypothetical protein
MNITNIPLSFGQRIDPANGLVQPWFTHGALDEIERMDLSDSVIVMFGAGLGDSWLSHRCKKLYVVERNDEWLAKAKKLSDKYGNKNIEYIFRSCNDSSGAHEMYCKLPDDDVNIIINDDAYRTEVCEMAVDYFTKKPFGGILICDNWQQDFVWISEKAVEVMKPFQSHIHIQPDHEDHNGRPWQTAIFFL